MSHLTISKVNNNEDQIIESSTTYNTKDGDTHILMDPNEKKSPSDKSQLRELETMETICSHDKTDSNDLLKIIIDNDNENINNPIEEVDDYLPASPHQHNLLPTISESPLKKEVVNNSQSPLSEILSTNVYESILETPPLKRSISQSSLSDVSENSYKQLFDDNTGMELNRLYQPPPLSPFAIKSGVIFEGWLEKTSTITGLWLKRYYVLSESSLEFCVLRVYGKAIKTKWGIAPINLKTIIPISCVQSVVSSAAYKGKELKITIQSETGRIAKEHSYCNVSDAGSINSDDVRTSGIGKIKCISLKAPDAQSRLLWVTFIQNALDALHKAMYDRLEF